MKIMILEGGWSVEREVSFTSGKAVRDALESAGLACVSIDPPRDLRGFGEILEKEKPDVVFNALHGRWGEDGSIQALLDIAKVKYTHSGVLASSAAMNKEFSRMVFVAAGLQVAPGKIATLFDLKHLKASEFPVVAKPICEGSSLGVHIIHSERDRDAALEDALLAKRFLLEKFIPGREISCAVLNGEALGIIELRPKLDFYSYQAKYSDGYCEHLMPAPLNEYEQAAVLKLSARAFSAMGCRGVARVDFRYDDSLGIEDGLFALELNTQPGLTPLSLAPEIAKYAGISFSQLVLNLIEHAQFDD